MLKVFKGMKKKLGSSPKLAGSGEAGGDIEAPLPPAGGAPPPTLAPPTAPLGVPAPQGPAIPASPAPAGLPPRHRPPSPPPSYHQQPLGEADAYPSVDYELVAGPLELERCMPEECHDAGQAGEPDGHNSDAAAAGSPREADDRRSWHGSVPGSGHASGDEEGEGCRDGDRRGGGASGAAAAAEAAAAEGITDALATMMYLTEDPEGAEECMSVVSDALSEEDLPDDISELSRALEALEGETLGSSPASAAGLSGFGGLDDQLAERLGISPDVGDPTAYSQQMAKLYNNLGLKMMERRKHEEALGLLRKAEAIVENEAVWGSHSHRRQRMQAITCNNLGCLFKRHNMPQVALQYLQKALALEQLGGPVQNSSSTHLNISAAFSALKRPKEALGHAETAIILLQRHLWPHHVPFQEGLAFVTRQLAAPGASRQLLASANVLAMAYHNAAVEHEKLGRLREALVSFTRAHLIASKCLGPKAPMTGSLHKALKAFQQRQARYLPTGAAHAVRKAPSSLASAHQSKRGLGHTRGSTKSVAGGKSSGSLASKASMAAAASGKATLPLDKASKANLGARPPSASRLASQL